MSDPVPTNDDDTTPTEDDMLATSIDPTDLGETPAPRPETPTVNGPRPAEGFTVRPDVKARLEGILGAPLENFADDDADREHPIPRSEVLGDQQRDRNEETWVNTLRLFDQMDLADWRLDDLADDQHPQTLRDYVTAVARGNPKVRNLVLAGTVGPGKSSAAIALGWALLDLGKTVRFLEHGQYLQYLQPDRKLPAPYADLTGDDLKKRMIAADVLILDDLGASLEPDKAVTEHVKRETMQLLGARINTPGKITVTTTNRRSEELDVMFGKQVVSRLSKQGHVLTFTGPDRRGRLSW